MWTGKCWQQHRKHLTAVERHRADRAQCLCTIVSALYCCAGLPAALNAQFGDLLSHILMGTLFYNIPPRVALSSPGHLGWTWLGVTFIRSCILVANALHLVNSSAVDTVLGKGGIAALVAIETTFVPFQQVRCCSLRRLHGM